MPSSPARHAAIALGYRGKQIEKAAAIIDREMGILRVTNPFGCEFCAQPPGTEHLVACRTRDSDPEPGELQFAYPRVDVDLPDIDPRERYDDVDEARAVVAGDWGAD